MSEIAQEQMPSPSAPEIPPQPDSTPVKKQHGGKRTGAGRKPNLVKRLIAGLKPATAAEVLESVDVEKVIKEIFAKGSLTLKQRTLADLWDRAYGKPAQSLNVAGSMVHAHVWRPLEQYGLTEEELAVMLKARMKMEAKGQNAAQDGPHNQLESSTAIEAVAVESEAT